MEAIAQQLAGSMLVGKESSRHIANFSCGIPTDLALTIVVFGASGDLAKKKTLPAIFSLFVEGYLPDEFQVLGYARSDLTNEAFHDRFKDNLHGAKEDVAEFLGRTKYISGGYDKGDDIKQLAAYLRSFETSLNTTAVGRLFYLALPPAVYPAVAGAVKEHCLSPYLPTAPGSGSRRCPSFWTRLIVEKPFGHDLQSSEEMSAAINALFPEKQIFRIDHYLGKELSQNMLVLRFSNQFFEAVWNRNYIANVQLVFKEPFGTEGRGGYFDSSGIIRDVMQNHLMQVLALVAMERPVSLQPDDIRTEKVKVLRSMSPVFAKDTVLGQYAAAGSKPGYTDDDTVPKGSNTPTFACCVLRINNPRWAGVPFIMRAGKALDGRKAEIRLQFHPVPALLFPHDENATRNELVMRIQPDESIYLKMMVKKPGFDMETTMSELDLSYTQRYKDLRIPDAYERLILDAIRGDQQHFVRRDELQASWAVFTPLLHAIDRGEVKSVPYPYGSRGPPEADKLMAREGYVRTKNYQYYPNPEAKDDTDHKDHARASPAKPSKM